MCKKQSYVVSAAVVVAVVTMLFSPMTGTAGSLDPGTAPASTMKTLDQIPPTWSQTITDGTRFQLVFGGAGVLDKETGLVWEQTPSSTTQNWLIAITTCGQKNVGGRFGWHLPTLEQLASLVDPSVAYPGPTLPSGHPFTGVQSSNYWSATTDANSTYAWVVYFNGGYVSYASKAENHYVCCVRGGQTLDSL